MSDDLPIVQALYDPMAAGRLASAWATRLEVPVDAMVLDAPVGPPMGLPVATAMFRCAEGCVGALQVDAQLVAGVVGRLANSRSSAIGPVPLSPVEEGLFAFLTLSVLALLPSEPVLTAVHGGSPDWPLIELPPSICTWRLKVDGQSGLIRWYLGPAEPARVECTVYAGSAQVDLRHLAAGAMVPITGSPFVTVGGQRYGVEFEGTDADFGMVRTAVSKQPTSIPGARVLTFELGVWQLPDLRVPNRTRWPLRLPARPVVRIFDGDTLVATGWWDTERRQVFISQLA